MRKNTPKPTLGQKDLALKTLIANTEVTYHRDGGAVIEPGPFGIPHGTAGWRDKKLVIYNKNWSEPGWCDLDKYQALKRQAQYEAMRGGVPLPEYRHPASYRQPVPSHMTSDR